MAESGRSSAVEISRSKIYTHCLERADCVGKEATGA